jgi:hypothetical protein
MIFLLEHETYGDEAPCVVSDCLGNVLFDEAWNGFLDFYESIEA